jgi:hypothetical protein
MKKCKAELQAHKGNEIVIERRISSEKDENCKNGRGGKTYR